jgi:hypothetical protein
LSKPVVEQRDAETGAVIREFVFERTGAELVPTPDGSSLIYTANGTLHERRLADMHDRILMAVDEPWRLQGPGGISLSRDGDRVAVAVMNEKANPPDMAAMVVSRRTGIVTLVRFPVPAYPAAWMDGGRRLLAVTMKPEPDRRVRLFAHDPIAGSSQDLGLVAEQPRQFRVHPGGREVLFTAGQSRTELWWLNAPR